MSREVSSRDTPYNQWLWGLVVVDFVVDGCERNEILNMNTFGRLSVHAV